MTAHRVAILALDGVMPLDLAIPVQIFTSRAETPYEAIVCGEAATVDTSGPISVTVEADLARAFSADTLIVPGAEPPGRPSDVVIEGLAAARDRGARIVSICTGAFPLAAAGVLDGLHATTHWRYVDELERDFPAVVVDRDVLYVDQGDVLTSAGVCCGIDLCLHIVRRDLGAAVANRIARGLVAAPHRDGGQAQYVPAPVAVAGESSLSGTREWALEHLDQQVTLRDLARHAGVSRRTLIRRFADETGTTPMQWLLDARLSRARELLESTADGMDHIARACGLGSAANLRLHFRRALDTTPTAYRRAFGN